MSQPAALNRRALLTAFGAGLAAAAVPGGGALARRGGRKALVVGNGQYLHGPDLKNPVPDARAVGLALEAMNYQVTYAENLNLRALSAAFAQFARDLNAYDDAVVFFGGHGVLVDGATYLLPTDALMRDEHDLITALPLNEVVEGLRRDLRAAVVLVDACRDNPLLSHRATRSIQPSGALPRPRTETLRLPFGLVIGYAAQPGSVAYDGEGAHSPYVTALLRHMGRREMDVELMLRAVRRDVVLATGGAQVPWTQSSLLDSFTLHAAPGLMEQPGIARDPYTAPPPQRLGAPQPAANGLGGEGARLERRARLRDRLCRAPALRNSLSCR